METKVSPMWSMKGWSFGEWIHGNKELVKIVIGAIVAILMLYPAYASLFIVGGLGTIVVKALMDIIDFYSSEVKLS